MQTKHQIIYWKIWDEARLNKKLKNLIIVTKIKLHSFHFRAILNSGGKLIRVQFRFLKLNQRFLIDKS